MSTEAASHGEATRRWVVATQVKSHRVVYYTDDPDYQPPMHGDWYYVSAYEGQLPDGMTVRNCWRWRFNGMEFADAGPVKPADGSASLLQINKEALLELLTRRIDILRRPCEPSCAGGAELRQRKLAQAQAIREGGTSDVTLLREIAAVHGCELPEMARRIVENEHRRGDLLVRTEIQREQFAAAIAKATTPQELVALRTRVVDEVAADRAEPTPPVIDNTTPERLQKPLDAKQLVDEQLRLRIRLRNRINDLRRPYASQYLLDDVVLGRKMELASAVQRAGGALPPGLDGSLLLSHAAARGQRLADAANDVIAESRDLRGALVATEQMKDAMLVRIASAASRADVKDAESSIETLTLVATAEAQTK